MADISIEKMKADLEAAIKQREQMMADINAISGVINYLTFNLENATKEEKPEPEQKKD